MTTTYQQPTTQVVKYEAPTKIVEAPRRISYTKEPTHTTYVNNKRTSYVEPVVNRVAYDSQPRLSTSYTRPITTYSSNLNVSRPSHTYTTPATNTVYKSTTLAEPVRSYTNTTNAVSTYPTYSKPDTFLGRTSTVAPDRGTNVVRRVQNTLGTSRISQAYSPSTTSVRGTSPYRGTSYTKNY